MKRSETGMKILSIVFLCLVLSIPSQATKRLTWNSGNSMGPVIAVDSKNHIFTVWDDDTTGDAEIYLKKSTDGGATWTTKRLTWTTNSSVKPAIAIDSNDHVHIVFYDSSEGPYKIHYRKSTDGGTTWTSKKLTWTSESSENPDIAIDSNDHIHLIWQMSVPGNYDLFYKKSTDGGNSWNGTKRLTSNTGYSFYPSIATDTGNAIHVAWRDDTPGFTEIFYMNSTDGGTTWSSKRLTWGKFFNNQPDIAINTNDHIYVLWPDSGKGNIYWKKSTDGGMTWAIKKLTWTLGDSTSPAIAINPGNNHIHLVWQEAPPLGNYNIYHKLSTDSGGSWTNKRLSWNTGDSRHAAIAVDSSDNFHIVWEDDSPGNYEIFYTHK